MPADDRVGSSSADPQPVILVPPSRTDQCRKGATGGDVEGNVSGPTSIPHHRLADRPTRSRLIPNGVPVSTPRRTGPSVRIGVSTYGIVQNRREHDLLAGSPYGDQRPQHV